MAKLSEKDSNGTSFHNVTIETTPNTLRKLFPDGDEGVSGDDKSQMNFTCETEEGDVFTIYDWKLYRPLKDNEVIKFHIGGRNGFVTMVAKQELEEMIEDLDSTGLTYTGKS